MAGGTNGDNSNKVVYICHSCKTNSTKKELSWIDCAGCGHHFDTKCQRIKPAEFKVFNERADALWLCKDCIVIMCPERGFISALRTFLPPAMDSPTELDDVMVEIKVLQTKLETMQIEQAAIKTTVDGLQTDVMEQLPTDIKTQSDKKLNEIGLNLSSKLEDFSQRIPPLNGKDWADILKQDTPTRPPSVNVTVQSLKQALAEAKEADEESEVRSRGIVVYRAEETYNPNEKDDQRQKNADEDLIRRLLERLECDEYQLESVFRLGKFDQERVAEKKFRPLKVRFLSSEARDKVLNSLSKLRNAPKDLNALSIRQDLNYHQRQELNNKIKEAKEQSKDLTDGVFRVRGTPGNYYLLEIKHRQNQRNFLAQGQSQETAIA